MDTLSSTKEARIYNGLKTISLTSGAGKSGQPLVKVTNKVVEEAVGAKVMESLTPAQMVIKIVNEQLTQLMGGEAAPASLF